MQTSLSKECMVTWYFIFNSFKHFSIPKFQLGTQFQVWSLDVLLGFMCGTTQSNIADVCGISLLFVPALAANAENKKNHNHLIFNFIKSFQIVFFYFEQRKWNEFIGFADTLDWTGKNDWWGKKRLHRVFPWRARSIG